MTTICSKRKQRPAEDINNINMQLLHIHQHGTRTGQESIEACDINYYKHPMG